MPLAASPPHAMFTRRRCCPTARCWWQEEKVQQRRSRSAELYDPATGTWSATGSLTTARDCHTATLLPNGKVLVAGGSNSSGALSERGTVRSGYRDVERHRQPRHRTRLVTRRRCCPTARCWWQGDLAAAAFLRSAELYDPASGTWSATGSLTTARELHTATLLPNGKVLVAGGDGSSGVLASAELYDVGLGFVRPDWQPQITTATSPLVLGSSLMLTGSRFQGISQASGGNFQDSSTNYPVVQLRAIDNSQVAFLPVDPIAGWSDTTFTSTPVNNFPPGPALVTVFTNGIPSDSKYVLVASFRPESNTYTYGRRYGYSNSSDATAHTHSDSNSNGNGNSYSNANTDTYSDSSA